MNNFIGIHREFVQKLRKNYLNVSLKDHLDRIVQILNENIENSNEYYLFLTEISNEFLGIEQLNLFDREEIVEHEFILMLLEIFDTLLTKLILIDLKRNEELCLDSISILITNLWIYKNEIIIDEKISKKRQENDLKNYGKIFFPPLKMNLGKLIDELLEKSFPSHHIQYRLVDRFLRLWFKLDSFDWNFIHDRLIKCLKSKKFIEIYQRIDLTRCQATPEELLFLYQIPVILQKKDRISNFRLNDQVCDDLIGKSHSILHTNLETAFKGEVKIQALTWFFQFLNIFAMRPTARFHFIKNPDDNPSVVDQLLTIISNDNLIKLAQETSSIIDSNVSLIAYSETILYNLVFEKKIFDYLKEKKTMNQLRKLEQINVDTIQYVSRTLIVILEKENFDEKEENLSELCRSNILLIRYTIDNLENMFHGIRLDAVLTNLEEVIQYDSLKDEIVNQDGLFLISECYVRPNLDREAIRLPALRILEGLSFCKDRERIFQEDERLMNYLETQSQENVEERAIANRILWKTVEQEQFINQLDENKTSIRQGPTRRTLEKFDEKKAIYQYVPGDYYFRVDVPISTDKSTIFLSCHPSDRDFCQKICKRLQESNYKVSMDENNVHPLNPKAMASNIERNSIKIICLSDAYKKSYPSRLEAEYIDERKFDLIGIIGTNEYHNTQWTEKFISNKDIINFKEMDSKSAFSRLVDLIECIQKNQKK